MTNYDELVAEIKSGAYITHDRFDAAGAIVQLQARVAELLGEQRRDRENGHEWRKVAEHARGERDQLKADLAAARARLIDMKQQKDSAYEERNRVVAALAAAHPSGIARTAIEGWSDDWHGCVYIDLPTGQASWHYHDSQAHLFAHLPAYAGAWDGHTTDEKYERLSALAGKDAT